MNCDPSIHDVDVILLCASIVKRLGLEASTTLHINSLGSAESMSHYRALLKVSPQDVYQ